tara:strand:+ start:826 stop:1359 length:534 start_codon:yes stop_codon:yes gene_type:complete
MAIQFRKYGQKVADALQKILREEWPGTPIYFVNRENYRAVSSPHFGLIPGDTQVIESYGGGNLREYEFMIRYYIRKPRATNHFQTNIHEYLSDTSERLIRLIDNKNKHEDENIYFGEIADTFGEITDLFSDIIAYRWHNARISNVDFDPDRTEKEDKKDLQIMEAEFLCNVMEIRVV